MPKIKVLQLIPRLTLGGAERLVGLVSARLDSNIFEVIVASTVAGGPLQEVLVESGVDFFAGDRATMHGRFGVFKNILALAKSYKPDIIHSHLLSADFIADLLKKKLPNHPVWLSTQHNNEHNTSWLRRLAWRIILPHADMVVAVSSSVAEGTHADFGVPTARIKTINHGIELDRWLNISTNDLLQNSKLRLLTIGRLEKQKGHRYLLSAVAKLSIPWELTIVGEGSEEKSLHEQARKLNIEKNIIWIPPTFTLEKIYQDNDVVVQPSLWEGRSLVVMEALAAGRVLVATPSAAADLVANNQTGFVVSAGEVSPLVFALTEVTRDPAKAKQFAAQGREFARANCDIQKTVQELSSLYQSLLA